MNTFCKAFLLLIFMGCILPYQEVNAQYICKPCNASCDLLAFSEPGLCPQCEMGLIAGSQEVDEDIHLSKGSGNFLFKDSRDPAKSIRVFYYKPKNFTADSEILMVIPGAGRNGDDYRDSWIELSEKYSVLILSPSFSEIFYGFEDYHLGGVISKSNIIGLVSPIEGTNRVLVDEANLEFTVNPDPTAWLFGQFDHIFDTAVAATGSKQTTYDLFGHSAGGHILHRLALFHSSHKINRILASNASFYTLPNSEYSYPFGLAKSPLEGKDLASVFANKLVVFLGEEDNAQETGGTFLVSSSADAQGSHRLERGKFFYEEAKKTAKNLGFDFNWKLVVVPGIGHNYKKMGEAAAKYLY
ncbi:hypothetical protein ACT6NV_10600 [Robiginitalea sp. IMCC44478]|uniref:hypothetical protein n=1 Tax=Robiginitalea sp. IMCC44478 TaxID=3459122 RepID=UPI00404369EC